jgi:hypothetical protein
VSDGHWRDRGRGQYMGNGQYNETGSTPKSIVLPASHETVQEGRHHRDHDVCVAQL